MFNEDGNGHLGITDMWNRLMSDLGAAFTS
jgi:hypothetical protein